MKLVRIFMLPAVLLSLTAGCSMVGKWSLTNVEPSAARRDFQYEVLTLEKDGSFYAEAKEPTTRTTSGTYSHKDKMLTLAEHNGDKHTYEAELLESGNKLRLKEIWKDRQLVADFDRKQ